MRTRPIIAVSPDRGFASQLAAALHAAGDAVSVHHTLHYVDEGDLKTALVVVHAAGEVAAELPQFLPRFGGDSRVIAVLPRSGLASIVELMQGSQHVAGMMVAEDFDARELATMAARALSGDLFGLDKQVPAGTQIHSETIRDYRGKLECAARIMAVVAEAAPPAHHAAIEQCVDEMLMNALYAAPMDLQGKRVFAGVPPRARTTLAIPQEVVVQYACDGRTLSIAVRDAFGSLPRQTVLNVLYKCLHDDQSVDTKASGAGVGLYLMVSSATSVGWNVVPGVASEVTCTFDLAAPKLRLQQLAFFLEQRDVTGKLPTDAVQKLTPRVLRNVRRHRADAPKTAKYGRYAVIAAAALGVLLVGYGVYARVTAIAKTARVEVTTVPAGAFVELEGKAIGKAEGALSLGDLEIGHAYAVTAHLVGYQTSQTVVQPHDGTNSVTIELAPQPATVTLDSDPTGAVVVLDGKPLGGTPLDLTTLPPGKKVTVVLKRPGYHDANVEIDVPARGQAKKITQKLVVSDDFVLVHLVSKPSGARVYALGPNAPDLGRTYTPADVMVEAGKPQQFMLTMPNHAPLVVPAFTAEKGSPPIEKGGDLVAGPSLRIEAKTEGKITVSNAPQCTDVDVPVDCPLSPGGYTVEFVPAGGGAKQTRSLTLSADVTLKF